ncbi:amidohydrolase family protein [Aureimonas fodinaquatilis]|uniref:Amidohydrolase family protein n=1 Tax=Aureimonas fodinaquatilis TaxID=2565783 RepID=A0A5B0DUQ6_9HYPH|nr:amidohydrolase family protein [Aureimonas fodinaquatilis]KAA0969521.1 amidohydrolase family protein [Aureimonas fodinaquatilis]
MLRLGSKYQHFAAGCSCSAPILQRVSQRLAGLSRRQFLAGLTGAVVASTMPGRALAQPQPEKILFRNVRLFDGKSDSLQSGAQVLVSGNRIAEVDFANNAPPENAEIIDCADRVLMPGLIDAHWHTLYAAVPMQVLMSGDLGMIFTISTAEAQRTLMRGFTTVRDMGGPVFSFGQAIDRGIIPGPRIFPSGTMITTSGGHGDLRMPYEIPRDGETLSLSELMGASSIVDDVGDLNRRVREQLLQGASQVKLVGGGGVSSPRSPLDISTFSRDEIRSAVQVARDWNTYVTVHAYAPITVQRAIDAGASCVEHAHLMDEETAQMMAEKDVWLSTQPFLTMADAASQTGPGAERAQQIFDRTPTLYEWVRKYGIKTAWGSDILFSQELAPRQSNMLTHLANWYSNAQALRMATSTNAELLALSGPRSPYIGKLGVIEPEALADILVVNGNPLEDIALLEKPDENLAIIMKDGKFAKQSLT